VTAGAPRAARSARELPMWPLIMAIGAALVAWNAYPLREHAMHVRMSDLTFVPDPILGRALCLGQCGAASKLQWIDSFTYFELQSEIRNDTLAGSGASGFERLYDLLIAEDPLYQRFYEYAAFNTGSLLRRHNVALGYLERGLLEMPHNPELWREVAADFVACYDLELHHPEQMDAFLSAWAAAMEDDIQRRQVWDWKTAMDRRRHLGLTQLAYWQDQLKRFKASSAEGKYILTAIREELDRYCIDELQALAEAHQAQLLIPASSIADCADTRLVATRYPHGPPSFGPLRLVGGVAVLRPDPYGYPFAFHDGKVVSPGLLESVARNYLGVYQNQLAKAAKGAPIASIEQARALAEMMWLPPCGRWVIANGQLDLQWDPPPSPPWTVGPDSDGAGGAPSAQ
jgi:hypothetical protein